MQNPCVKSPKSQYGRVNWSLLLGFLLAVSLSVQIAMFLPVFLNNYKVNQATYSLKKTPQVAILPKDKIRQLFLNRMQDNEATGIVINEIEIRTDTRNNKRIVRIHYDAVIHVINNISIVTRFSDTVSI